MALSSNLNLRLGIDVSDLDKELKKVERTLGRFGNNMKNIGSNLTASLTMPIIGLGAAALKSFADIEKLENGLIAIMGNSEAAAIELQKLRKVAENPGLALPQVVQASASLQSVGMSADAARETITQFGNAVARSGGGAEQFSGVVLALSQISAVGKVTQEDLNQIKERLPEFARVMQQEFGVTTAEAIRELGISSEEFITRSVGALGNLERANGGLANTFDNLKDNVSASLAELGKTINQSLNLQEVASKLSLAIQGLVDKFKALSPEQQGMIVKIGLIAAGIGPLILILGQLASSISSIIALSRVLIGVFATMTGGMYLLVVAIGSLIAYYATTDEGQKSLAKSGKYLSDTFERVSELFSTTLSLLGELKPLFGFLLEVFAKIAAFSFEIILVQINALLKTFISVYDTARAFLKYLNLIKDTDPKKSSTGFGGGSAGRQSGAGGGFGEPAAASSATSNVKNIPIVSAMSKEQLDKINKALKERIAINEENLSKIGLGAVKAESLLQNALYNYNEVFGFNGAEGMLNTLNLMPDKLTSTQIGVDKLKDSTNALTTAQKAAGNAIQYTDEKITRLKEGLKTLNEGVKNIIEGTLQDLAYTFGEELANALNGASFSLKNLLLPIANAVISFGKLAIQVGIAALGIQTALQSLNLVVAIAAGIALVALGTLVKNSLGTPKLAQGGLAYGPTLATVGDNKNARVDPEVIAPLSKLKSMMGDMGVGGTLETRISGNDLIILLNRSQKGLNRIQ